MPADDAKKRRPKKGTTPEGASFEAALDALEAAVTDLERGDLGIDASLARYEEGVAHLRRCQEILRAAEQKVEKLLAEADAAGAPRTAPLDAPADEPAS